MYIYIYIILSSSHRKQQSYNILQCNLIKLRQDLTQTSLPLQ